MPHKPQKQSPKRVREAARRREGLRLRIKGLTFEEIGKELGITRQGAHVLVKAALSEVAQENTELAEDLLTKELAMYEEMQRKLWEAFQDGDLDMAPKLLALSDRRTKLLDLQPATKHEVKGGVTFVLSDSDANL